MIGITEVLKYFSVNRFHGKDERGDGLKLKNGSFAKAYAGPTYMTHQTARLSDFRQNDKDMGTELTQVQCIGKTPKARKNISPQVLFLAIL